MVRHAFGQVFARKMHGIYTILLQPVTPYSLTNSCSLLFCVQFPYPSRPILTITITTVHVPALPQLSCPSCFEDRKGKSKNHPRDPPRPDCGHHHRSVVGAAPLRPRRRRRSVAVAAGIPKPTPLALPKPSSAGVSYRLCRRATAAPLLRAAVAVCAATHALGRDPPRHLCCTLATFCLRSTSAAKVNIYLNILCRNNKIKPTCTPWTQAAGDDVFIWTIQTR